MHNERPTSPLDNLSDMQRRDYFIARARREQAQFIGRTVAGAVRGLRNLVG